MLLAPQTRARERSNENAPTNRPKRTWPTTSWNIPEDEYSPNLEVVGEKKPESDHTKEMSAKSAQAVTIGVKGFDAFLAKTKPLNRQVFKMRDV